MLGVREGVLLGRTIDAITHPDDVALDAKRAARPAARAQRRRYEVEKRLLDAQRRARSPRSCRSRSRATTTASCARCSSRSRTSASAAARSARGRSSCASRPRAPRPRRPPSASARSARSPTRRWRRSGSTTCCSELLARITDVLGVDGAAIVLEEEAQGHVVVHAAGEAAAYVREHGRHQGGLAARDHARARGRSSSPTRRQDDELADHPLGSAVAVARRRAAAGRRRGRSARSRSARSSRARSPTTRSTCSSSPPTAPRWRSSACGCFERQQTIAEELQRSLLPQSLPAVPGLAMAARYLPGGAGTRVGGDWYDTIPLPGGRVALVIGDVAGRGVDAAAMMGQLRSALRAYILEGATPAEALERLNRFMLVARVGLDGDRVRAAARARDRPPDATRTPAIRRRTCSSPDGVARSLTEPLGVPLGALDVVGYERGRRRRSSPARRSCSTPTASSSSATSSSTAASSASRPRWSTAARSSPSRCASASCAARSAATARTTT